MLLSNNILIFDSLNSTNIYAQELLRNEKLPEGTVILAKKQTDGRGQFDRKWESEGQQNLTFSIILYPVFLPVEEGFLLCKTIAVAVAQFVKKMINTSIHEVSIKWPNDIYVGDSKIGGILIENAIRGFTFRYSVVGIGINVNQKLFGAHLPNPVSLSSLTGHTYEISACLSELIEIIDKYYFALKSGNCDPDIGMQYRDFLYQQRVYRWFRISKNEKTSYLYGRILRVDDFGCLIIETENQGRYIFQHNEIFFCEKKDVDRRFLV